VSDGFWRARLASDPRAVGRSLVVNGQTYTILGVLPSRLRSVTGFGLAPEIYLPISRALMPDIDRPYAGAAQLIGRLRPDQPLEAGRAALDTVVRRRHAADAGRPRQLGAFARVTDGFLGLGPVSAFFGVLALVGALVLGIACANVAGLLLARNTVRSKELALRASLGASRWRLAQQLLVEAGWLAALGTACGIGFMLLVMATIAALPLPLPLPLEIHAPIDWRLFGLMLTMVVTTTLVSGVLPALQGARAALAPALKLEARSYVHRRWTLRGLLVIGQVAISVGLVVTALLFLRNLLLANGLDAGFETRRTLVAHVGLIEGQYTPERRVALLAAAVERLGRLPGAERAAFAYGMPLTIRHGQTNQMKIAIDGVGGGRPFLARWAQNAVGDGYFATLGIPVTRGREFTAADAPGTPRVAIVNEAFISQYLGGRSPVGQRLHIPDAGPDGNAEIVGVTSNIRHRSIGEAQLAAIYWAYRQRPGDARVAHVVVGSAGDPAALRRPVEQALAALEPTAAIDVQTVSQSLAFAFLPSRVGAALLGGLGIIGLTLAMAGLFALVSYSVSRRTREIGVRMALGAPRRAVVRLVVADAVVLVATGVVVGLGLAALMTPPLALFLVIGLSPNDPIAFAGTAVLFAAISAIATLPPIRRAIGVGPLVALRTE
jgi:putative ABC transport system permease protein